MTCSRRCFGAARRVLPVGALWLATQAIAAQALPPAYSLTDIGSVAGSELRLNELGEIAGAYHTPDFNTRAFLYSAGRRTTLDGLTGASATGLNGRSQVLGHADQGRFVWSRGSGAQFLNPAEVQHLNVNAINDAGRIAGTDVGNHLATKALVTSLGGGTTFLGTLGGPSSEARSISNSGWITGRAELANGDSHAFLYRDGKGMTDLGAIGFANGFYSSGVDVNNAGNVAGSFVSEVRGFDYLYRAFTYTPGQGLRDLGSLGNGFSSAAALNDAGTVVGDAYSDQLRSPVGFVYTPAGGMTDLNTLVDRRSFEGLTLISADDINNRGQIAARGIYADGRVSGFLLTPKNGYGGVCKAPTGLRAMLGA